MTPEQRSDKWAAICGKRHKCGVGYTYIVCRFCRVEMIREAEEAIYAECSDYFRHDYGCSADVDERYDCRCDLTNFRKRWAERGSDEPVGA